MTSTADTHRKFKLLGTRPVRSDGLDDKVTGRALFGADFNTAGLLHGKILRSPHAHANILSIDTSKAEDLIGVMAVVTASDLAVIGNKTPDLAQARSDARTVAENDLAFDKALYKGHAVAAVAANSSHIAEEAISLIDVKYEVLPAVLNVMDAMKDDAPIPHKDMTTMFRTVNFARERVLV